jgi:cyclohexa-1,5-dienecarbonyl-CoA hydratase
MSRSAIRCVAEHGGQVERIVLSRPKANVLDLEMISEIRRRLAELDAERGNLKLLVFEGEGAHFSFGASVAEHLPEKVGVLLPSFHHLFWDLEALGVPTAAVVRGQCLGGGFELVLWCGLVFCDATARFGVPETKLGVFPPMASIALPWRLTGARSTQLILSGETVDGAAAAKRGLADACVEDPEAELERWFREHLEPKSAVALRSAWRASRRLLADSLKNDLQSLEKLYLQDLMSHHDPVEGIRAFVERREPVWRNR